MSLPPTIAGLNQLPTSEKRNAYLEVITRELSDFFNIPEDLRDAQGDDFFSTVQLQDWAFPYPNKIILPDEISPTSKTRKEVMTV